MPGILPAAGRRPATSLDSKSKSGRTLARPGHNHSPTISCAFTPRAYGREAPRLNGECLAALAAWSFPGNVRELEGEMARPAAVSPLGALLGPEALNDRIRGISRTTPVAVAPMSLAEMEKKLILAVLESMGGNRTRAAEIPGISREGLRTKMQRLLPSVPEYQ